MIPFTNVTRRLLFLPLRSCSPSVTPLTCPRSRSSTGLLEPMRCTVERGDAPAFCLVAPEHRRAVISFSILLRRLCMGCRAFGCYYDRPKFSNHLLSLFFRLGILCVLLMSCGHLTSLRILNECLTRSQK